MNATAAASTAKLCLTNVFFMDVFAFVALFGVVRLVFDVFILTQNARTYFGNMNVNSNRSCQSAPKSFGVTTL